MRSALALSRRDAAKAPAELEPAVPYEASGITLALYPVYLRGEAELAAKRGKEAAEAYQKIGEYRGVVANGLPAALARLGLARAYALSAVRIAPNRSPSLNGLRRRGSGPAWPTR